MSHGDYVRHSSGVWTTTQVPTWADVGQMDVNAAQMVNGDAGGVWAPATPVRIGGAPGGSGNPCLLASASVASGGITTQRGGRLQLSPGIWPALSAPVTRKVLVDLARCAGNVAGQGNPITLSTSPMGIQVSQSGSAFVSLPKRFMHHGATLTKIQLMFSVSNLGQGLPAVGPGFSFAVVNVDGSVQASSIQSLRPWAPGRAIPLGTTAFFKPTPANETGLVYAYTSGVTGGVEPTWPTAIGGAGADGTCIIQAVDSSGFMSQSQIASTYGSKKTSVNTLVGMSFGANTIAPFFSVSWAYAPTASGLVIDTSQNEYGVVLNTDGLATPDVTFTSLLLTYSVATLQTE